MRWRRKRRSTRSSQSVQTSHAERSSSNIMQMMMYSSYDIEFNNCKYVRILSIKWFLTSRQLFSCRQWCQCLKLTIGWGREICSRWTLQLHILCICSLLRHTKFSWRSGNKGWGFEGEHGEQYQRNEWL